MPDRHDSRSRPAPPLSEAIAILEQHRRAARAELPRNVAWIAGLCDWLAESAVYCDEPAPAILGEAERELHAWGERLARGLDELAE